MALVNSAFKAANQPLIARQVVLRPTYYTDTWWISSAVDFLQSQHLTLTLNNPTANPRALLLHQKFPDMNLQTTNALSLYSIASQKELFMEGDRPPPELNTIIHSLRIAPLPTQPIPLRSDQTWAVTINGITHIHQLMGQLPNGTWQTAKWIAGCAHPQRGDVLVFPRGVHSLIGAGGSDTLSEAAFEAPDANPRLVTLGAETYCKKVSTRVK